MTIALECINLIIPIALIEKKHPGGWQAFLTENPGLPLDYYDQHLLRLGAMDSLGILFLIEDWKKKGFKPYKTVDGIKHWKDMCVVDTFSGPTLPCTWLQFDAVRRTASLAGSDRQSNFSLTPGNKIIEMKIPKYLTDNVEAIHSKTQNATKIANDFYKIENESVKAVLALFPAKHILREDVTQFFIDKKIVKGVYAAMIWGGMSTSGITGNNFGKLLDVSDERICEVVAKITEMLRDGHVKLAFDYMEDEKGGKIRGLGHAFFTKIFFFVSVAGGFKVIAPIYDKWTKLAHYALLHDSNNKNFADEYFSKRNGDVVNLRSCSSDAYQDYVNRMEAWAAALGVTVCKLETFIFGNHKGKDKKLDNPRLEFPRMLTAINQ